MKKLAIALSGFIILFALYHSAEYMIMFRNSPAGFLGFQMLFFLSAWLIAKWQGMSGLSAWGLRMQPRFLVQLLAGLLIGIILYGGTFLMTRLLGIEYVRFVPPLSAIGGPLALFVFGNFFSSFSEDILTRGYVYHHLKGRINNVLLAIISATVYVLNHIYRWGDGIQAYTYLFALGVLFIIPLILTGRLWFTSGMHWAGNSFFYLTHEIFKTETADAALSPNYILVVAVLVIIPLNYFLLRTLKMTQAEVV